MVVRINGVVDQTVSLATITGRIIAHGLGGNDSIRVSPNVPVGADLYGDAGNDRLFGGIGKDRLDGGPGNDYVNGGANDDRLIAGSGTDILVGAGGLDTLVGPDAAATWQIGGRNAGRVNGTSRFNSVENLLGGTADDTFAFGYGGSVAGRIDGGAGVNALSYSAFLGGVRVNLFTGTATRTAGIANITNVVGGAGDDVLVGNALDNQLTGNGGRDILIGGGGADVLNGGARDDLLIGGRTTHDGNPADLGRLMSEWARRDVSYANRISHLTNVTSGGRNGAAVLTAATVSDDGGAPDALTGGTETRLVHHVRRRHDGRDRDGNRAVAVVEFETRPARRGRERREEPTPVAHAPASPLRLGHRCPTMPPCPRERSFADACWPQFCLPWSLCRWPGIAGMSIARGGSFATPPSPASRPRTHGGGGRTLRRTSRHCLTIRMQPTSLPNSITLFGHIGHSHRTGPTTGVPCSIRLVPRTDSWTRKVTA